MRAPKSERTGTAGVSEVSAAFQRLDWGVAENSRHDLGTDLFLLARDERRFDLGLIVGAQVKSGRSYFARPKRDPDGEIVGWWFRDSTSKHIDSWLKHTLPHLVVLHDSCERVSYWAHVTPESIERTGKGAKLLVPRAQVVSADHRGALLEVARSQRQGVPWEGSIWTAGADVAPGDLLRYALVVPRLVAPHPNAGTSGGLAPEQAVAMLVQGRVDEYDRFASEHAEVPTRSEAHESPDWRWRLVGSIAERVTTTRPDRLRSAADDAPSSSARAAATVAAAAALTELAQPEESLLLLDAEIGRDEAEPVDHAWLLMQRARVCAEVGRLDEARADALAVVGVRNDAPSDATASALAGAASILLFDTSTWGSRELEQAIIGADTAAMWWRRQTTAGGLEASVARTFRAWAGGTTESGPEYRASNQLIAASLLASHLGSQGGWRHLAGLTACELLVRLDRHVDQDSATEGLRELRLAGATKDLRLAARRVAGDGPASAAAAVLGDIDLKLSTRTTVGGDLALLTVVGHLADEPTAARAAAQLTSILGDGADFLRRTSAPSGIAMDLLDALAGVAPAAGSADGGEIREHILSLNGVQEQAIATGYARVAGALPDHVWDSESAERARVGAEGHHDALRLALLGIAAPWDRAASAALIDLVREGSPDAMAALGDATKLPADVVPGMTIRLAGLVERAIADARRGSWDFGSQDDGRSLVVLSALHPDSARWEPVLRLLADHRVFMAQKRGSLDALQSLGDRVPRDVQEQLAPIARQIMRREMPRTEGFFGEPISAVGEATCLLLALDAIDADESARVLLDLLGGDQRDRLAASRVAACQGGHESLGVLVALAADADVDVRAAAAEGLARRATEVEGEPLARAALEACVDDPGWRVPARAAYALRAAGGSMVEGLLSPLRTHVSAHVRAAASAAG